MKKLFSFISVFALAAILGISSVSAKSVAKVTEVTEGPVLVDVAKDGIKLSPSGDTLYVAHRGGDASAVRAYNAATLELIADLPGFVFGNNYGGDVTVDDRGYVYATRAIIAATSEVVVARWTSITDTPDTLVALLGETYGITSSFRAGYGFDVNIDKSGNGFVIIPVPCSAGAAGASFVYVPVVNDVAGTPQQVALSKNYGVYPRVRIVNDTQFWYDANAAAPVLVTMAVADDGTVSLAKELAFPTMATPTINGQGNGVSDFVIGDQRFMVIGTNNHNLAQEAWIAKNLEMLASVSIDEAISAEWIAGLPIEGIGTASNSIGCTTSDVSVKDGVATIFVAANSNGLRKFTFELVETVNVTLVCDSTMGTVTGGGEVGKNVETTVVATPNLGYSFVAWLDGTDTVSTQAEYKFVAKEDITLTAVFQKEEPVKFTLAVNDATKGTINISDSTIVMGENTVAYGTKLTLTAVPVEGATFMGWYTGETMYNASATIEVAVTADLSLVANFMNVLKLEYDLGGGVTNDYGWLSKADMYYALNADLNAYAGINETWLAYEKQLGGNGQSNGSIPTFVGTAGERDKFLAMFSDSITDAKYGQKWGWLAKYMDKVAATQYKKMDATQGVKTQPTTASGTFTFSIANFFGKDNNHTADYIDAVDFTGVESEITSYQTTWEHAYTNPTEVTEEFVLNDPYHPTLTFYGWYTNAEFTGEKVTTVSPASVIPGGKLYAKFDEYIPTIAEVLAMEEGVETKISGVVNWVRNNNVFIQDATGGFLLYGSKLAPEVGTKIIAKGKRASFSGSPQLSNTVIEAAEKATLYAPVKTDLATLLSDSTALKYFGQRIQVLGVKIEKFGEKGNAFVTDGTNSVECYYMTPDQSVFKVGTKVDVIAVASQHNGTFQFEGDVNGITVTVVGLKDPYNYPVRGEGKYTLENKWVISNQMDNFASNMPGADQKVRGMAAKDGIMYFINQAGYLVRVDGATGAMLDPLYITGDHLFQAQGEDGTWSSAVTYGFNDIKFDSEGHCLISGLTTNSQHFMVYEVDIETGAATIIIDERLQDNPDYADAAFRFDAFGVNGDVHGNACIMAADATGTFDVYRWLIIDGEVQPGEAISMLLNPAVDKTLALNAEGGLVAGWGTAPQIFPQSEDGSLFYVDGFNTLPMLFDDGGSLVDDFYYCPTGVQMWNNPGDTTKLAVGLNGLQEFQVGNDYFLVMIATHTPSTPPQAFGLYKFADEARSFSGLEPLWYFPAAGIGSASNGVRTAVPTVEVKGNVATIYLYGQNNGYAVYTLTCPEIPGASVVDVVTDTTIGVEKVLENANVYVIKNGVKYNMLGAEVK